MIGHMVGLGAAATAGELPLSRTARSMHGVTSSEVMTSHDSSADGTASTPAAPCPRSGSPRRFS